MVRERRELERPSRIRDRTEDKMAKEPQSQKSNKDIVAPKSKKEEDRELSRELEDSFPASDPPASTQPGSGITGPEVKSTSK